jgi:hypothetical protein
MFGSLRDRLVKELAHAGLRDIETARGLSAAAQRSLRQGCGARASADPELLRETLRIEEERVVGRDNAVLWGCEAAAGRTAACEPTTSRRA